MKINNSNKSKPKNSNCKNTLKNCSFTQRKHSKKIRIFPKIKKTIKDRPQA